MVCISVKMSHESGCKKQTDETLPRCKNLLWERSDSDLPVGFLRGRDRRVVTDMNRARKMIQESFYLSEHTDFSLSSFPTDSEV